MAPLPLPIPYVYIARVRVPRMLLLHNGALRRAVECTPCHSHANNVPRPDGLLAVLLGLVLVLAQVEVPGAGRVSRSPLSLLFEFFLFRFVLFSFAFLRQAIYRSLYHYREGRGCR